MDHISIKAALERAGKLQADIARATDLSPQLVGEVIRRTRRNVKIEGAIAEAIGKPVAEVFPDTAPAGAVGA